MDFLTLAAECELMMIFSDTSFALLALWFYLEVDQSHVDSQGDSYLESKTRLGKIALKFELLVHHRLDFEGSLESLHLMPLTMSLTS